MTKAFFRGFPKSYHKKPGVLETSLFSGVAPQQPLAPLTPILLGGATGGGVPLPRGVFSLLFYASIFFDGAILCVLDAGALLQSS